MTPEAVQRQKSRIAERYGDEGAVFLKVKQARADGAEITGGTARTIASWLVRDDDHVGSAFVACGSLVTVTATEWWDRVVGLEYRRQDVYTRAALDALRVYVWSRYRHGETASIEEWGTMWVRPLVVDGRKERARLSR